MYIRTWLEHAYRAEPFLDERRSSLAISPVRPKFPPIHSAERYLDPRLLRRRLLLITDQRAIWLAKGFCRYSSFVNQSSVCPAAIARKETKLV